MPSKACVNCFGVKVVCKFHEVESAFGDPEKQTQFQVFSSHHKKMKTIHFCSFLLKNEPILMILTHFDHFLAIFR